MNAAKFGLIRKGSDSSASLLLNENLPRAYFKDVEWLINGEIKGALVQSFIRIADLSRINMVKSASSFIINDNILEKHKSRLFLQ
ncbi:hypothetical protein AMELA_G00219700 [Ameiurus melas]|uniref:Uncharacterized protein n=1 Tax=Ameiurus melas TaxID=219545 RepID=A0A7J6A4F4_AMEME|nr:hypothetical protein AMELA_G00219700 [Ameiurus melas]